MDAAARKPKRLTVRRSFVVELYEDADVAAGRIAGRVEHVVSGRSARFSGTASLFAFMAKILEGPRRRRRRPDPEEAPKGEACDADSNRIG